MKDFIINLILVIAGAGVFASWLMDVEDFFWFKSPKYRNKKIIEEKCKNGDCKDTDVKYPDEMI